MFQRHFVTRSARYSAFAHAYCFGLPRATGRLTGISGSEAAATRSKQSCGGATHFRYCSSFRQEGLLGSWLFADDLYRTDFSPALNEARDEPFRSTVDR